MSLSPTPVEASSQSRQQAILDLAIWGVLVVSILAVYAQVANFDFTDYDDGLYVYHNAQVQAGLTPDSVRWAMTAVVSSNWMPVTLLSHITDGQLFQMHGGMHHLENVMWHILSAVLLFAVLRRATGAPGPSAFAAFIFGLHPLHVESVAWVSERKDVLSTFWWFIALYAYLRYVEKPSPGRYLAIVAPFCIGLMSKPMLVTFPFTLLLFDFWPLRRLEWPRAFREKLPLFGLSAASCVVTYWVQKATGSVQPTPLLTRAGNALISYMTYIGQTLWPTRLAVFYSYRPVIVIWQAVAGLVIVAGISALVVRAWRTRPYLAMGWFWYLGTLVPVIGLVQVGVQAHADRYMYIPMLGLSVMLSWGAADIIRQWPRTKPAIAALAVAACGLCLALTWKQVSYWQNTEVLFTHALDVTENNWGAQYYLGNYFMKIPGRRAEAVEHFEAALRIRPDLAEASNTLGVCMAEAGLCAAAIPHFEEALRFKPTLAEADNNLAWCMINSGRYQDAVTPLEAAIRINPDNPEYHFNLARAFEKLPGRSADAITQYEIVLRAKPDYVEVHQNLGTLLESLGRTGEAAQHLETAQRLRIARPSPQ